MSKLDVAFLVIGNEILSGRTHESNVQVLAAHLANKGRRLTEIRVVPDDVAIIAKHVLELSTSHRCIFTSGGIGPTHDDVTVDAIAEAFAVQVEENKQACEVLEHYYAKRGLVFSSVRRRMTRMPVGAQLVGATREIAPGFNLKNVYVCAGVPSIFAIMVEDALIDFVAEAKNYSLSLVVKSHESQIAEALAQIAQTASELEIGSYPKSGPPPYCELIFSGYSEQAVEAARELMECKLRELEIDFSKSS